jgi:hypothetical protein
MTTTPCPRECHTWCSDDIGLDAVLGHHHHCPHAPDPVRALRGLVRDLATGMDVWAADCDGIHPAAWEAYRRAKLLGGEFVRDEPAAQPLPPAPTTMPAAVSRTCGCGCAAPRPGSPDEPLGGGELRDAYRDMEGRYKVARAQLNAMLRGRGA